MKQAGELIDAARARGVDVAADMYVYMAGGTGLEATIPTWAQEGGRAELLKRLADPEIRARLKKEIVKVRGRAWADLRFAAIPAGVKDYRDGIVYTRFFSTSYNGQLLEINFTSNLERSREIKEQIDGIIESVILDEAASSAIKPPATSAPHSTELPPPIDETLGFFDIERQKFALAGKIVRVEITGKAISADPLGGKLVRVMVKDTAEHYGLVEFPRAGLEKLGISASYAGKPVALYLLITPQGAKPTAKATAVGSRFTHGSDGTGTYEW